MEQSTEALIQHIVNGLEDKKALDVTVLKLQEGESLADAFVIATGNSDVHMRTLLRVTEEAFDQHQVPYRLEGEHSTQWALVDSADVIVHIFGVKAREFYKLERIWAKPQTAVVEETPKEETPGATEE